MKNIYRFTGILIAIMMLVSPVFAASIPNQWPSAGNTLSNTRFQNNTSLSVQKAANLQVQWQFTTGGDVSATPSVDVNNVYFPDWGGNFFAVNRATGLQVWSHKVSDYTGIAGDIARDTPAIYGDTLIFGDQAGYHGSGTAYVVAVEKNTGALLWRTAVGSVFTIITQSAVVDNGTAYIGLASSEEAFEGFIPGYPCCSFRGAVIALDAATGVIKWQTYTAPAGYSGNSVWGSTPVVDKKRNSLYVTTGNNYSIPASAQNCVAAAGNDAAAVQACMAPDNYFDSILSLDLNTGAVKWSKPAIAYDSFNLDCFPQLLPPGYVVNPSNCPSPAGPDYDFGQGAMLWRKNGTDFVGAGQKSGQFWALNPDTGKVLWMTQAVPGGVAGGLQWGSSTDGKNVYVAAANSLHQPWVVNGVTITTAFWEALDAGTGAVVWQTADPAGGLDSAPVASINGVVFGCSLDPHGNMYAMDSSNGHILWSHASGGSCLSGAAIAGGNIYWGSGYSNFGSGTGNNQFFAFSVK